MVNVNKVIAPSVNLWHLIAESKGTYGVSIEQTPP